MLCRAYIIFTQTLAENRLFPHFVIEYIQDLHSMLSYLGRQLSNNRAYYEMGEGVVIFADLDSTPF